MSKQKRCIFVQERICPFQTKQVPFQTCQICIEAWKTEVAIKKQQFQGAQMMPSYQQQPQPEGHRVSLPAIENGGSAVINEKLKARNLDAQQKAFIDMRLKSLQLSSDDPAAAGAEVDKFLDAQLAEFAQTAKLFGAGDGNGAGKDTEAKVGAPSTDGSAGGSITSPEGNDFIPR